MDQKKKKKKKKKKASSIRMGLNEIDTGSIVVSQPVQRKTLLQKMPQLSKGLTTSARGTDDLRCSAIRESAKATSTFFLKKLSDKKVCQVFVGI